MHHTCIAMKHDCVGAAFTMFSKTRTVWYSQVIQKTHTLVVPPNNWPVGDRLEG